MRFSVSRNRYAAETSCARSCGQRMWFGLRSKSAGSQAQSCTDCAPRSVEIAHSITVRPTCGRVGRSCERPDRQKPAPASGPQIPLRANRQTPKPGCSSSISADISARGSRRTPNIFAAWLINADFFYLGPHGGQVIAPRQVVDIRAQSSPIAFRLCAVVPLGHYLINATRAVHDLLHLDFCLQVVRGGVEFATQSICGAIQIVHSIFQIVFRLSGLVPTVLRVGRICTLAARTGSTVLCRISAVLRVVSAIVEIFLELIDAILHLANTVGDLPLRKWIRLCRRYRGKAESGKNSCAAE